MMFTAPTITALRESFTVKPSTYKVSAEPTQHEIKRLRKSVHANLRDTVCLIPGTDTTGWLWLIQTPDEWNDMHTTRDPNANVPAFPTITNPGIFTVDDAWTDKALARKKEEYLMSLYLFQHKTNLERALLLDLSDAIPSSLVADLQDDDGRFLNVNVLTLVDHMENTYDQLRPKDIQDVMDDFNKPYEETMPLAEYFKRQQKCQSLLKKTPEPISQATMIRTCYSHFLRLPHMANACDDWDDKHPGTGATATWPEFKLYFTQKFRQHNNRQTSLRDMGIANSAITTTEFQNLQAQLAAVQENSAGQAAEMSALREQNQTLLDHLKVLANLAKSSGAGLPPACVPATASDLTDDSRLATDVSKLSRRVDSLQATANQQSADTNKAPRTKRKFKNDNYCWTHGADIHPLHNSKTCKHPAPGHQTEATITNRMNGSEANLKLVL